ncbi:hypothetical protein [Kocuria marina]|uniref:hypothetical protein n=1 Tax=Kocuria marina TaxID=223184 RepID=UPI00345F89D4
MPDPTYPTVLSPAQKSRRVQETNELARQGLRHNAVATLGGLACLLVGLPFVGIAVSWWFSRKSQAVGNPALLGRTVLWVDVVATAVLVVVVLRVILAIAAAPAA